MNRVLSSVLSAEPDATVPWTQRQMKLGKFGTHMRSEFALHRWGVAGDDDASLELLSDPTLTAHAIDVLGRILLRRGQQSGEAPLGFSVHLRAPHQPDVVLTVAGGTAQLDMNTVQADGRALRCDDAAARLLLLA